MNNAAAVQDLCTQHEGKLKVLAQKVSACSAWDLNIPIGVIDARAGTHKFHITSAGTIGTVVRMSTTIDHPLMQRLFELIPDRGDVAALEELLNDEEVGEEFASVFSEYQEERKGGAPLWSADDATAFVNKCRDAFDDKEIAVVALLHGEPHHLVTFAVPLFHYGS